jgi:hypothetical protein
MLSVITDGNCVACSPQDILPNVSNVLKIKCSLILDRIGNTYLF